MGEALPEERLEEPLAALIRHAREAGADAADAIGVYGRSSGVAVRGGELEDIDNSEGSDIGLRVLIGRRQACVSGSDLSSAALQRLAERAVAMAKLAPEDPYCGLAPADRLSERTHADGLELADATQLSPEQLKARALEVEAAALSVPGVRQAEGAQASFSVSSVRLMTSHGFDGGYSSTRHGLSVSALAEQDGAMERDYDYGSTRWMADLRTPEDIGRKAGERAVRRLGSAPMSSGAMPIIFSRRVSGSLVGALLGAINGAAVARGVSFLKDALKDGVGDQLFPKVVQIIDDPLRVRGLGTRPFDGEGVATDITNIIENGQLTTWLLNSSAARQLGLQTTGHAARGLSSPPGISTSNVHLSAGVESLDALIAKAGNGMLVREMFGPSLNPTTGDYSVGCSGTEIRGGQLAGPVSEVTIAGNLRDMFASLEAADDLHFEHEVNAPSVLLGGMTLAGK